MRHSKGKWRKRFFWVLAGMMLSGAGSVEDTFFPAESRMVVFAAENSLSKTAVTVSVGERYTLSVKGSYKKVTWSVDDKSVAAVTGKGVVKGVSAGTATITANVDGAKYKCTVTVEAPKLNRTKLTARVGNTYNLKVSGTSRKVTYKSSDTSVVKVSSKGKLSFLKPGRATVTAAIGSSKLKCVVKVNTPAITVGNLVLGETGAVDLAGKKYKNISYESSNPAVLSVDGNGVLTANRPGSAQITVRIADHEYKKRVSVKNSLSAAVKYGIYEGLSAEEEKVAKKAHAVLASVVTDDMEEIEKIAALHDYIVLNTAYDTTYRYYSVEDTLIRGTAVCQGYAETMELFLNVLGIENQLIYGTCDGVSHVWNLIFLDGSWYHMDVTWDDPLNENGKDMPGYVRYEYFMTDDVAMAGNHTWKTAEYPRAFGGVHETYIAEKLAEQFKAEGLFAETRAEFLDMVVQSAAAGKKEVTILYAGAASGQSALLQDAANALAKANPGKKAEVSGRTEQIGEYMQVMLEMKLH